MDAQPWIFVVENDNEIREALTDLLLDEGYRVTSVSSGAEALERLRQPGERPVVILLDLMMPKMTGYEVLEHLGQDPALAAIPVVVCSAMVSAPTPGVRRHLKKPFGLKALLETVSELADSAGYRSNETSSG